jgi:catalase
VIVLFSDRDLAKSYRTYSFINAANERCWVKFHLKTIQGIATLTNAAPAGIVGEDRESHQRDLFEAIERADYPKWRLGVQIVPQADVEKTLYNPFDLTNV